MATILQALKFNLAAPIDATQVSIPVRNLKDSRGTAITAMVGSLLYATIEPRSNSNQEIISFTGITDNGNGVVTLTGVTRNLDPRPPYATLGGLVPHGNNAECILSNNPPFYNEFIRTDGDSIVTGSIQFPSPNLPANAATKAYADSLAIAGAPDASTTTKGLARLTASPDVTLGNPTITIASPAVTSLTAHGLTVGDSVKFTTTGALPTGILPNSTYYVIATGLAANTFQISATLGGGAINTSGSQSGTHTLVRTTPRVLSETDSRIPTADQVAALAGAGATPNAGNKFVTQDLLPKITTFSATGNFAKTGLPKFVRIQSWAGGGSGAKDASNNAAGGGGGAYKEVWLDGNTVPKATIGTCTISIASPAVISFTAHGLTIGDVIQLTTTGALPTGLLVSTIYYVIAAGFTANSFQVSATQGGGAINTSGSQSGVHTLLGFVPIVIGAGGALRTTDSSGLAGGNTTIGLRLTAFGGAGGAFGSTPSRGGGGGGEYAASAGGGVGGSFGGATSPTTPFTAIGAASLWGGGHGGSSDGSISGNGGFAIYGGGGGGSRRAAGTSGTGGDSMFGGDGGTGGAAGTAGSVPAGGGGGSSSGDSGAGANGLVIITEFY